MNTWHNQSISDVAHLLATDMEQGLADTDIAARLARYGQNKLRKGKRVSALVIFVSQSSRLAQA